MSVITKLYYYPIKSCRGIACESLLVSPEGVQGDRRYMVIDEAGQFVSARTEPRLLLVDVFEKDSGFIARTPGGSELELRSDYPYRDSCEAQVWSDKTFARSHKEGSEFFSEYLSRKVRLAFLPDEHLRQVDPRRALTGDRVAFADAYPLLLVSEASLSNLNGRLQESGRPALTMERFRPNIVIDGAYPHEEDELKEFRFGDIEFSMPKLCDRCVMTTHDPLTATGGPEPLRTLAQYRKWEGKVWFGANLLIRGSGSLSLGLPLRR